MTYELSILKTDCLREESVNEIRILASVRHPNVVSYCQAFVENDKLYIVRIWSFFVVLFS